MNGGGGWHAAGSITVTISAGEYITTRYIWNDKLEEKYSEKRSYETNDVSEFVNQTDKIVEVEQRELTEEEKTAGARPDLRLDAYDIFNGIEVGYYESLEEDEEITRIDMINATPSIYNDYLYEEEVYSDYIGYSRSYLSYSYTLLNKHLAEIEELQKSSGTLGLDFTIIGSNFIWPLKETGGEKLTSCVGPRIRTWDTGATELHGAMDISAPNGYSIVAAQSGTVHLIRADSGTGTGYGNYVVLKHGEVGDYVYYTLYAHMNSYSGTNGLNLKVGDTVQAGQVIGYVGSTGDSSGNHLHFELIPWPKSDNNGNYYFNYKKYNTIEPILYIQRNTIPERILNQASLPEECNDITTADFGKYAATGSSTADSYNTGTKYEGGSFVFSEEITSALASNSYSSDTFNRSLTSAGSYYKTTPISNIGGSAYSARTKPATNDEKDAALYTMSDLELLARTIYSEQDCNSEESGVLVGISILNRAKNNASIADVLKAKYKGPTTGIIHYSYNVVGGDKFWSSIPPYAKELALKACAAVQNGSYKINGIECIEVGSFYAQSSSDFPDNDNAYSKYLVLENTISGSEKYTGFFGW